MKKALVIIGVVLIIFSTISIVNVTQGQSGAGLYGMLTFYLIMLVISGTLIYFGIRKPKEIRETQKAETKTNEKLKNLKDLYIQGILTKEEYETKSKTLNENTAKSNLKSTPEYKKLKSLYEDGILTKDEFENKTENLEINTGQPKESQSRAYTIGEKLIVAFYIVIFVVLVIVLVNGWW